MGLGVGPGVTVEAARVEHVHRFTQHIGAAHAVGGWAGVGLGVAPGVAVEVVESAAGKPCAVG